MSSAPSSSSSSSSSSLSPLPSWVSSVPSRYSSLHVNPCGPSDRRPTARDVLLDEKVCDSVSFSNRTFLITGGTSGIGLTTAQALYETGAEIWITARDESKGLEAVKSITAKKCNNSYAVKFVVLQLDDLSSVRAAAKSFLSSSSRLNVLINNAGIMACPFSKTKDGFELQFGTNHLGHFLFFELLKPLLLKSSSPSFHSRVISLSSIGHRRSGVDFENLDFSKKPYNEWVAYSQAKTANIYFASEIERRYGSQGLHGLSVHPGGIATNLTRHMSEEHISAFKTEEWNRMFKSPEQGAATTVWAAVSKDLEGKGGVYLENVSISRPFAGENNQINNLKIEGFAPHAYNADAEKKLWEISSRMVNLENN